MGLMSCVYYILFWFSCFPLVRIVASANFINTTHFLKDPETLVSNNANFKFGFFSPNSSTNRYVGVMYNNKKDLDFGLSEVIWIANRDNPLKDSSGLVRISEHGNLQLLDDRNNVLWSSNISYQPNNTVAQLLDSGNLVLLSGNETIWQSFEHPTNVFVPPVTLTVDTDSNEVNPKFKSWKSASDPSSGRFSFGLLPRDFPETFVLDGDKLFWRSGPWNGYVHLGLPNMHSEASTGFQFIKQDKGQIVLSYSTGISSLLERFVLNYDGRLILQDWNDSSQKWELVWKSLESECDVYGKCGEYGSCDPKNSPICTCLEGFEPKRVDQWRKGNWSSGCVRTKPLQCETLEGKPDKFLMLPHMKVPDYSYSVSSSGPDDCESKCSQNCSCLAFAHYSGMGCMMWNSLIDIQQFSADGADLFVRLAHSELGKTSEGKKIATIIAIPVAAVAFIVFSYFCWKWMRQHHVSVRLLQHRDITEAATAGYEKTDKDNTKVQAQFDDLPLFKFEKLEAATDFFSIKMKIGQGGFGPVYKGKLEDGNEIAVKRLSKESGQGLQEFMNEVIVISKLQHRNLVRLLGCCVERDEKLLVYEYMPKKSLDALLFGPSHREYLDWEKRFSVIKGICRGLLYLHRDSRLKIIHRDLKASNILLDDALNPKISDFGMARIFGGNQEQGDTKRIVGTYGYMSPEYAMEGRFSEKSDVFSLGVLLLEIVSGRRNNSFADHECLSLVSYAWRLWNENDILSLVDETIYESLYKSQILKCIQLGLLCVQENPKDRPTISDVISILDVNELSDLPLPKQPGFTQTKSYCIDVLQNGKKHGSVNLLSLTTIDGR